MVLENMFLKHRRHATRSLWTNVRLRGRMLHQPIIFQHNRATAGWVIDDLANFCCRFFVCFFLRFMNSANRHPHALAQGRRPTKAYLETTLQSLFYVSHALILFEMIAAEMWVGVDNWRCCLHSDQLSAFCIRPEVDCFQVLIVHQRAKFQDSPGVHARLSY